MKSRRIAERRIPIAVALVLALVLPSATRAQGKVWVVAAAPGPGVDFSGGAGIQLAIVAAADGDLVLVKGGAYQDLTIDGKSLIVIADAGASTRHFGTATVLNLSASQSVALRGLEMSAQASHLRCLQNAGPIWIESSVWSDFGSEFCVVSDAVTSIDSTSVALQRITAGVLDGWGIGVASGVGISAVRSAVHVFDSTIRGGDGHVCGLSGFPPSAGASDGARVVDGFLFASGSTIRGGKALGCWFDAYCCCHDGSAGGDGLELLAGGHGELLDTILQAGPGSPSNCPSPWSCAATPPGTDLHLVGGSFGSLQEVSRSFQVSSPVRAGQSATLQASGNPGDLVVALFSSRQEHVFLPNLGTLLLPLDLGGQTGFVVLGTTNASGTLQASVPLPPFPSGLEFLALYMQAAFIGPHLVTILSGGSLLVVLNQAF